MDFLEVWPDRVPRRPDLQMAVDEAVLLAGLKVPVLRHYRWAGHAATFGISQSLEAARAEARGFELVRRWTGGGVVRHDADWTFSLIVPRGHPFCGLRPVESYLRIHSAVGAALRDAGIPATMATPEHCRLGLSCFTAPALHDLLVPGGRKACGGAQRRSRQGLLHQGSIQNVELPGDFADRLAGHLATKSCGFAIPDGLLEAAEELASARYGNEAWLAKIP